MFSTQQTIISVHFNVVIIVKYYSTCGIFKRIFSINWILTVAKKEFRNDLSFHFFRGDIKCSEMINVKIFLKR